MTPIRLRIRELREAKGWSQAELAERAGTRQATISEYETGTTTRPDVRGSHEVLSKEDDAPGIKTGAS